MKQNEEVKSQSEKKVPLLLQILESSWSYSLVSKIAWIQSKLPSTYSKSGFNFLKSVLRLP